MRLHDRFSGEPGATPANSAGTATGGRSAQSCPHCGVVAPSGANFCPECGSPRSPDLLDPLAVSGRTDPTVAQSRDRSRLGMLLGLVALAGLAIVLLVVTRDQTGPGYDPGTGGGLGQATATPTTSVPTSSAGPAPTTTTTPEPVAFFLGEGPAPVLDEDVRGTLVGFSGRRMLRIDLSTGLVDLVELERSVQFGLNNSVVIGTEIVSGGGRLPIITDLVTGEQRRLYDPGQSSFGTSSEVAGPAGPETVWLSTDSGVHEVDLNGAVHRSVELPADFWAGGADGDVLYLYGPDGTWRYDTVDQHAEHLGGWVEPGRWGARVACDEALTCRVLVDTPVGPMELTGTASEGVWQEFSTSPDGTRALIWHWEDDGDVGGENSGPRLFHVDVLSGTRTEIGVLEADLWRGVLWIPDSSWVIVLSGDLGPVWLAVNGITSEVVTIDPVGVGDLKPLVPGMEHLNLRYLPPPGLAELEP